MRAPRRASGEAVLFEEVARDLGGLALLRAVDFVVEAPHHGVRQQRCDPVERLREDGWASASHCARPARPDRAERDACRPA